MMGVILALSLSLNFGLLGDTYAGALALKEAPPVASSSTEYEELYDRYTALSHRYQEMRKARVNLVLDRWTGNVDVYLGPQFMATEKGLCRPESALF